MDLIQVLILSVVEGVTEFLPISSTGHLILTSKLLNIYQSEFIKTFEISIQLGAILAVVFLYGAKFWFEREVLKRVIWVFIPTGILGFILYRLIKSYLIGNLMITVLALLIGGIVIICLEKFVFKKDGDLEIVDLSLKQSLLIGTVQVLSVIPGVSRSATTIFGGMFLGLSRRASTELSFLVALPVLVGATGLDLVQSINAVNQTNLSILALGITVSCLTATMTIRLLLDYIKANSYVFFGIYRIIIGLVFLLFLL